MTQQQMEQSTEQEPTLEVGSDVTNEDAALEEVRRAIRGITFGSVLIKIHQGEVVGIETATKVRFKGNGKPS